MRLKKAMQLVTADLRARKRGWRKVEPLDAINHVRVMYTHETIDDRIYDGTITDREMEWAYRMVIDARIRDIDSVLRYG